VTRTHNGVPSPTNLTFTLENPSLANAKRGTHTQSFSCTRVASQAQTAQPHPHLPPPSFLRSVGRSVQSVPSSKQAWLPPSLPLVQHSARARLLLISILSSRLLLVLSSSLLQRDATPQTHLQCLWQEAGNKKRYTNCFPTVLTVKSFWCPLSCVRSPV
jgi:hypothetical protein